MTALTETLAQTIGVSAACGVLAVPRSRVYRARQAHTPQSKPRRAGAVARRAGAGAPDAQQ